MEREIKFTEAENYKNIPEIIVLILEQESFEVVEDDSEREDFENYEHEFTFWKAEDINTAAHNEIRFINIKNYFEVRNELEQMTKQKDDLYNELFELKNK